MASWPTHCTQHLCPSTIPADALYCVALDRLRAGPHVDLRPGVAVEATESPGAVELQLGANSVRAAVAFDTRPAPDLGRHGLTQRFLGQEIETERSAFDPKTAMLMDFRCAHSGAAHFTYVLPTTARRALVEDTWFAPAGLRPPDHRRAIRDYMARQHGVDRFDVMFEERGALPMNPVFRPVPGGGCSRLARPAAPTGPARDMLSTPSRRVAT